MMMRHESLLCKKRLDETTCKDKKEKSFSTDFQTVSGSATDGNHDDKYQNTITGNYKNLNKRNIIMSILKRVA